MAAIVYDQPKWDLAAYERKCALERENKLQAEIEQLQAEQATLRNFLSGILTQAQLALHKEQKA